MANKSPAITHERNDKDTSKGEGSCKRLASFIHYLLPNAAQQLAVLVVIILLFCCFAWAEAVKFIIEGTSVYLMLILLTKTTKTHGQMSRTSRLGRKSSKTSAGKQVARSADAADIVNSQDPSELGPAVAAAPTAITNASAQAISNAPSRDSNCEVLAVGTPGEPTVPTTACLNAQEISDAPPCDSNCEGLATESLAVVPASKIATTSSEEISDAPTSALSCEGLAIDSAALASTPKIADTSSKEVNDAPMSESCCETVPTGTSAVALAPRSSSVIKDVPEELESEVTSAGGHVIEQILSDRSEASANAKTTTSEFSLSPTEREIRKLNKKLRDISRIHQCLDDGCTLNSAQKEKLAQASQIQLQLKMLQSRREEQILVAAPDQLSASATPALRHEEQDVPEELESEVTSAGGHVIEQILSDRSEEGKDARLTPLYECMSTQMSLQRWQKLACRQDACWEYIQTGWCPRGVTCAWTHPPLKSEVLSVMDVRYQASPEAFQLRPR